MKNATIKRRARRLLSQGLDTEATISRILEEIEDRVDEDVEEGGAVVQGVAAALGTLLIALGVPAGVGVATGAELISEALLDEVGDTVGRAAAQIQRARVRKLVEMVQNQPAPTPTPVTDRAEFRAALAARMELARAGRIVGARVGPGEHRAIPALVHPPES